LTEVCWLFYLTLTICQQLLIQYIAGSRTT
jgi:hypothetical protein